MDAISFHGLGSLFDPQLTSEIKPVLKHESTAINDKAPTPEDVTSIVNHLNDSLASLKTTLRFSVDNESNIFYVAVIDTKTKEMLRRFPIEELPNSTSKQHKPTGVFLNTKG